MYRNTPATIRPALEALQQAIREAGLDFELQAAAEYMLDDQFMALLDQDERLLTVFDNYILTEFPFSQPPLNPERLSFRIITAGSQPILAHPERYGYYHKEPDMYRRLAELGFHLQVNLLSFTGYYGKDVQKAAEWLHKNDLISFAGTDLHHVRHLEELKDVQWAGRAVNNDW
jgi:tyrosine-protein phosphatase YwqE